MREEKVMYCVHCGCENDNEDKFCIECGKELRSSDTKKNWKDYFTEENIERYAPLATFLPLVMSVVTGLLGGILHTIFGLIGFGEVIATIVVVLLKILFCAATLGATTGLIYVAVKRKNVSLIWTWVAPLATFLAFVACLGVAFSWSVVAWIFGLVAFLIGLEMAARITLVGKSMDTPMDPKAAGAVYKKYYQDYRAKYPTTKDLERAGIADPENSYFDGSGLELLGYTLLTSLVSTVTCGIAAPWMICKIYKWRLSHTVINGKRLTFTGTGGSLLGHWILWELLTIVTCGIYGFFMYVALSKWELSHTYIEGEPILVDQKNSYFDGTGLEYLGYSLLSGLMLCFTLGLAYPWAMCMIQKWDSKHQVINGRRLEFSGTGLGFLGEYIIIALLSLVTCGIYSSWGTVRMNKYIIRHTDFVKS